MKRHWKKWCTKSFTTSTALHQFWNVDDEWKMILTRDYYSCVKDCGNPNPSGYISEQAYLNKVNGRKTVDDHCYSPQFIGRMIHDNWDRYKDDYPEYEKVFYYSCKTIVVTKKENDALSEFTKNDDDGFRISVPTNLKYNKLGINLYKRYGGVKQWKDASPTYEDTFYVPEELLEYEKQYLVS